MGLVRVMDNSIQMDMCGGVYTIGGLDLPKMKTQGIFRQV